MFATRTSISLPVALSWQEIRLIAAIVVIGVLLAAIPVALAYRGSVAGALRA